MSSLNQEEREKMKKLMLLMLLVGINASAECDVRIVYIDGNPQRIVDCSARRDDDMDMGSRRGVDSFQRGVNQFNDSVDDYNFRRRR
jgi:hypothetical protein